MLVVKFGGFFLEKLLLEGISKEDVIVELKKNGVLIEIINKIKV